jgi:hypothetical protein
MAALCGAAKFREETSKKQEGNMVALLRDQMYRADCRHASEFLQCSIAFWQISGDDSVSQHKQSTCREACFGAAGRTGLTLG